MRKFCRFLLAVKRASEVAYAESLSIQKAVLMVQGVALVAAAEAFFFTLLLFC